MSIVEESRRLGSETYTVGEVAWHEFVGKTYECLVWLHPDPDGGYSATMPLLPGVISEGDTIDDTLRNISEAFLAAVESYGERGTEVPWQRDANEEKPSDVIEKWILVDG
jgi:antitoxin HicB